MIRDGLLLPPHSIEAEQCVLGCLMLDSETFFDVSAILTEGDFYREDHRIIYRAILNQSLLSKVFDVIALADTLDRNGKLEEIGGVPYLATIARDTASTANAAAYARIVLDHSRRRKLIAAAAKIAELSRGQEDVAAAIDEAQTLLSAIADQSKSDRGPQSVTDILMTLMDDIDRRFHAGGEIVGTSTGFSDMDKITSGLLGGEFWIIGGAPGMGKSTLAANIAEHVATQERKLVLYWSGEMGSLQCVRRAVAAAARVDKSLLRNGQLTDDDWPKLTLAVEKYHNMPLYVDDSPGLSIAQLRANVRRLARQSPPGLVVIDYLQLMTGQGENRVQEIASVSRGLKRLAIEFDVPVIAVASLNREISKRPNKRPVMSDLRECGDIEFDVDVGCFVYRDEIYKPDTIDKGIAEIIFRKVREGEPQTVPMRFLGDIGRFEQAFGGMPSWSKTIEQERREYGFN